MPFELLRIENLLPAFALVLARVSGVVLAVPMLSSVQIAREVKVWLSITLSLMIFPIASTHLPIGLSLGQAAAGMAGEFIIGEILGFGAGVVFYASELAGKFISHQAGLSLGTTFNPFFDEESMVLDQLWFFTAAALFLAFGGHVIIVKSLIDSIRAVPPMMAVFDGSVAEFAASILQFAFQLGLRLAGPTILALLLASLVMGFLTKTMPQINIMSVGFSFKILVALAMAALTISASQDILAEGMQTGFDSLRGLFNELKGAEGHGG